ncbi:MAG: penicillin-binding protein 1A [Actinomycetota bacterium]
MGTVDGTAGRIALPQAKAAPRKREGLSRSAPALLLAFAVTVASIAAVAAVSATAVASAFHTVITSGTNVAMAPPIQSSRIVDRAGRQIAFLHGEQDRTVITRSQMPMSVRKAVIAIEDADFYSHRGISMKGIFRSALRNAQRDDISQGGSTITQQYVRNAYAQVGHERTLARKVREAKIALRIERKMSKEAILDGYLNTVYFGRGAYGIEAAAKTYFWKPALKLNLWESAYLAGVIQSPERFSSHPKESLRRRNAVLARMLELKMITDSDFAKAKARPLGIRKPRPQPVRAAYFVEYVRRLLITPKKLGGYGLTDKQVYGGGLTIQTTLDLAMQDDAEKAVKSVLNLPDDPEVGFVATTTSGEVRAMVGGRNYTSLARARGFNFAAQVARGMGRQPGSTFKPFTLTAYLEKGFSPRRYFAAPSRISVRKCGNGRAPWQPANYQNESFGALSVIQGTEKSVNTVYAQMVAAAGPENVVDAARRAGITSPLEPVCSITLGVFGVTPLEMARAYSTFATGGLRPDTLAVTKITGPGGRIVAKRNPKLTRTIKEEIANAVTGILQRVVTNGTGRPAAIDRPSAGKTGTTEQHRDVWYAGFTPHPGLAAVAWIGYPPDEHGKIPVLRSLHGRTVTGGAFGGAIWKAFMQKAIEKAPVLEFPPGNLDSINSDDHSDLGLGISVGRPKATGSGLPVPLPYPSFVTVPPPPVVPVLPHPPPPRRHHNPHPPPKPHGSTNGGGQFTPA